MAIVESPFNPAYEKKHEETYLNYSRGADAPRAEKGFTPFEESSNLLDAGKLGLTVVSAKDEIYKERSKNEVVERVDAVRDAWIGNTAGGDGTSNANEPADLRRQLETMKKRTDQYSGKQISDRYYWAQMESIARTVRARYPGYREHIDNVISNMTGATPANALQRSISSEAEAADAEGKALRTELKELKNGIANSKIVPMTDEIEQSTDPDFIRRHMNKFNVNEGRIERQKRDNEMGDAQDARTIKRAESLYNEESNLKIARTVEGPVNELINKYKNLLKPGQRPSPDQIAEIGMQTRAVEAMWLAELETLNADPAYANVSSEVKKNKISEVTTRIRNLGAAISNGQWEIVNAEANTFKMINDGNAVNIVKGSEALAGAAAIRTVGGDIALERWYAIGKAPDGRSRMSQQDDELNKIKLINFANPNTPAQPLQKLVDDINNDANITDKGAAITQGIDKVVGTLTDKEMPAAMKEHAAESLFSPKNATFLADPVIAKGKNGRGRIAVFKQMTSPEVAQSMLEVKTRNPALYDNYINWRNYTFTALFKRDLDTIARIPTDDQTINVQFNAKTGKLIEQSRGQAGLWDTVVSYTMGSSPAIRNFNEYIDAMTPTWKLEGLDPGVEAKKLVDSMNINFNAVKGDNLFAAIGKAFKTAVEEGSAEVSKRRDAAGITEGQTRIPDQYSRQNPDGMDSIERTLRSGAGGKESLERDLGLRGPDGDYKLLDPNDPEGIIDIINKLRDEKYEPGMRESKNIEDRRNEPKTLLDKVAYFIQNEMMSGDPDGDETAAFLEGPRSLSGNRTPAVQDPIPSTVPREILDTITGIPSFIEAVQGGNYTTAAVAAASVLPFGKAFKVIEGGKTVVEGLMKSSKSIDELKTGVEAVWQSIKSSPKVDWDMASSIMKTDRDIIDLKNGVERLSSLRNRYSMKGNPAIKDDIAAQEEKLSTLYQEIKESITKFGETK